MDSRGFLDSHEPVFARGGGFDAMAWAIKPAGPLLVRSPKDQLGGQWTLPFGSLHLQLSEPLAKNSRHELRPRPEDAGCRAHKQCGGQPSSLRDG